MSSGVSATPSTPADAQVVGLGTYNGTFNLYNDIDYYNFTGTTTNTYNFTFSQTAGNDLYLYVYDKDLNSLAMNSTPSLLNQRTIVLTGHAKYVVAVLSSEFAVFPANYKLTISQVGGRKTNKRIGK